jgi:hypothetical protein
MTKILRKDRNMLSKDSDSLPKWMMKKAKLKKNFWKLLDKDSYYYILTYLFCLLHTVYRNLQKKHRRKKLIHLIFGFIFILQISCFFLFFLNKPLLKKENNHNNKVKVPWNQDSKKKEPVAALKKVKKKKYYKCSGYLKPIMRMM